MYCTKCGTQMPDDVKFCPKCGESVFSPTNNIQKSPQPKEYPKNKWICSKCDHANALTNYVCSVCGSNRTEKVYTDTGMIGGDNVTWGCASQAWFILCIITNIITVFINIFTEYKDDLLGIMFLNLLTTIGVVIAYIGLLTKKQKRYMYILAALSIVYMFILINLKTSIAFAFLGSLANPAITFLVLLFGGHWLDMDT